MFLILHYIILYLEFYCWHVLNRSTQNSYLLAQLRPTLIIGSIFSLLRADLPLSLKLLFNKEKV